MIRAVQRERSTYADVPARFEAGTPAIAEAIGPRSCGRLSQGRRLGRSARS